MCGLFCQTQHRFCDSEKVMIMDEPALKGWNHTPAVPLKVSPFFRWPLRPLDMLAWMWNSWFLITEKLIIVAIALVSFYWFQPPLEETKTLAFGWVAQMFIRNLILMTAVAGGLHLYFYTSPNRAKPCAMTRVP